MMEPKMRFKGFEGKWEEIKFGEHIVSIQTGTNLLGNFHNSGAPLLKMGNIQRGSFILDKLEYLDEQTKIEPQNIVYYGDFFFNTRNTLELVGKGATWTGESGRFAFNSNIARFKFKDINTIFYNYLYNTPKVLLQVRARAMGTTSVAAIYPNNLNSIRYYLPNKAEQQQIAFYFKSLDNLIQSTTKKITSLKQLKSASLLSMFPQAGETKPRVRFKGFKGDWKKSKLNQFANRIIRKNKELETQLPLTISAIDGLISQDSFFNDIVASSNLSGYYLIKEGEFAYNKSYSNGYPFGAVKRLEKYNMGALSTLYIVFALNTNILSDYVACFFDTTLWHSEIAKRAAEGARNHGLLNINTDDFLDIEILFPPLLSEQQQIASFFSSLGTQISLETQRLDKLKQIKSACLDKMFV